MLKSHKKAFTSAIPSNIAIVMDGNRRWSELNNLTLADGYKKGLETGMKIIIEAVKIGVSSMTMFAFSSENWKRAKNQVQDLFSLFMRAMETDISKLLELNVRLLFIGNRKELDKDIIEKMEEVEKKTASCKALKLVIAINYGGKWDIVNAAKNIAHDVLEKKICLNDINENLFNTYLSSCGISDPDLFIRTSGEYRISNFLLWQFAYTEFYFTDVLWPDFNEKDFRKAIDFYMTRHRRYGGDSGQ